MIVRIRENAELVISLARKHLGRDVGFDRNGVQWLDGYIQRLHNAGTPASDNLVSTLGAYLGECIRACYGGHWAEVNGMWCVKFDDANAAFPFAKVFKQLENGAEDSVLSFFDATPLVFQFPAPGSANTPRNSS